ncbi:hypothetical protein [Sphingobium sp. C100]|nr:hypothetical protein [Sphingobium sp. C100]
MIRNPSVELSEVFRLEANANHLTDASSRAGHPSRRSKMTYRVGLRLLPV